MWDMNLCLYLISSIYIYIYVFDIWVCLQMGISMKPSDFNHQEWRFDQWGWLCQRGISRYSEIRRMVLTCCQWWTRLKLDKSKSAQGISDVSWCLMHISWKIWKSGLEFFSRGINQRHVCEESYLLYMYTYIVSCIYTVPVDVNECI